VQEHQPETRRRIREHSERQQVRRASGEKKEWRGTDPLQLQRHLAKPHYDPERDGLRITLRGAERLLMSFNTINDTSLEDAFGVTASDRSVIDLGATDPSLPAIAVDAVDPGNVIASSEAVPFIPNTRPGQEPVVELAPALANEPSSESMRVTGVLSATTPPHAPAVVSATPPAAPAPFADRNVSNGGREFYGDVPTFDPNAVRTRARWSTRLTVLALALTIASSFFVGAGAFAPPTAAWRPVVVVLAIGGLGLALLSGATALGLWWRNRPVVRRLEVMARRARP
jgi:hypothetical protein